MIITWFFVNKKIECIPLNSRMGLKNWIFCSFAHRHSDELHFIFIHFLWFSRSWIIRRFEMLTREEKKPYNNRNVYTWNDLARIFHRYIYLIPCIYRKMYIINWERHHKQLNAKDGLTLNEFKNKTIITRKEKKNMNIQRCLIEQNKNYNKIVQLTLHKCCSTFLDFFGGFFFLVHTKLYHRWPNKICKNEKIQLKYVWHINTPRTHVWKSAHTAEILYEINMV